MFFITTVLKGCKISVMETKADSFQESIASISIVVLPVEFVIIYDKIYLYKQKNKTICYI